MSGPGAAALGASPAWTVDTAKLRKGRSTVAPSSVSSFHFSPVRPRFPPPRVDSFPSCQRPASTLSLVSSLLPFHPINNVVSPSPTPSPFPPPDGQHLISFVCLCVGGLPVFRLSCQRYRVRVDHLVIDKRMRSGEAGKLNFTTAYR